MEYYNNVRNQLKSANNNNNKKSFIFNKHKDNKFIINNPLGYFSYSDNDISDKLSDKHSDYEDTNKYNDKFNLLKNKPNLNNYIINTQNFFKFNKEKSKKKIYNNNTYKELNYNNINNNNHHHKYLIKNNNHNYSVITSFNKSNDTYLNHYINKKNFSKNYKNSQSGKKFEKIKNNKKRKDYSSNETNNKFKPKHVKIKSLKSILDNSNDIIDEKIEHKDKVMNENTYNNMNNRLFVNKNINKNINYTYFILNSKNQINNKNNFYNIEDRRAELNNKPFQNKSLQSITTNYNKYKSYNSKSRDKDVYNSNYIYLRNSMRQNKNDFDNDNYFTNSHEYYDNNTLNAELRHSGNLINKVYIPINFGMPKIYNKKKKTFSKTFIGIKDTKNNDFLEKESKICQKNDISIKNKTDSNSQQKSYQKKLLNKNNSIKHKSNHNINFKKKDLTIKIGFEKTIQDYVIHKQTNTNSTSNLKATSPIASNVNRNLTNTEKTSRDKYDSILKNKIDLKQKISFNNMNNNTISNSKTIFNRKSNINIPAVKNKIENLKEKNEIRTNNNKIQQKITIYQKRKISNNKYNQPKIKKDNNDNENRNTTLLMKKFYTDNKISKNIDIKFIDQNIKKLDLFKFISSERKTSNLSNKNAYKKKINDNIEKNKKKNSKSDVIISNYLKREINNYNPFQSYIYMKGILKKWKNNAESMSNSLQMKELNLKIINKFGFQKKYYNFFIKKYKVKNYFITKRFKVRIPINKICVFSKNIILKDENYKINYSKEGANEIKKRTQVSMLENININDSKSNDYIKEDLDNNNNIFNKNMEIFVEGEENENEDFKIEEYEERHIDSLLNLNKNSNIINNSNSATNINNILIEENLRQDNKLVTLGKEDQPKSDRFSLKNSKMSINSKEKHFFKIGEGLEKICRIFFRNLEKKNEEINRKNMEKKLKMKKEKSESNIKNQSKYSSILSSTIQNWNGIDKQKHYIKEEISIDNDIKIKKNKKHKNPAKLLNINKAFSEEKAREQGDIFRRSAKLQSKFFFDKNNNNCYKNTEINMEINEEKKEFYNKENNYYTLNNQKEKYIELLNILSVKNYSSIFEKILNLINNNNNCIINISINNYEILLNNQFIFVDVLVDKSIKEKSYTSLYAKLSKDLHFKLLSNFIGLNKKKVKRENLKSIMCIQCKQKFDECDVITLLNLEKNKFNDKENMYESIKYKLLGIIDFICELINIKMISQKMGLEYLDILHKRITNFDTNINDLEDKNYLKTYKYLYIEGEVGLLEKLSKIIIERKKPKHIQNFKNFIEDNIIPMVENNKKSNEEISNYLICRIINLLEKLRNNELFQNIKQIKIEDKNNNNNNKIDNIKVDNKNINDNIDNIDNININKNNISEIDNTKKNNENNEDNDKSNIDNNEKKEDKNKNNENNNKNNQFNNEKKEENNDKKKQNNENIEDNNKKYKNNNEKKEDNNEIKEDNNEKKEDNNEIKEYINKNNNEDNDKIKEDNNKNNNEDNNEIKEDNNKNNEDNKQINEDNNKKIEDNSEIKEGNNKNNEENKNKKKEDNNDTNEDNKIIDSNESQKIEIEIKTDRNSENINLLKKEIENYMIFLSEHKIEQNKDISYDINDEFNWSIVEDLVFKKHISLEDIVTYFIKICTDIIDDKSKIYKANEYIKNIINYYSYNLNNKNINSMHLKMIQLFLDIDNICMNNPNMFEIMGYLLFILLSNKCKFFIIKDLNNFLNKDINTQINIAKTVKFTIISFGYNWKKYYNIFKKANLFKENDIFNNYISNPLKTDGFKI